MSKVPTHSVTAVRHHSFAGKEYEPGDTYTVSGDAHQTADQYLDSLSGAGLAKLTGDNTGPNYVDEVGPEPAAALAAPTAAGEVAPAPAPEPESKPKPAAAPKAKKSKPAGKSAKKK